MVGEGVGLLPTVAVAVRLVVASAVAWPKEDGKRDISRKSEWCRRAALSKEGWRGDQRLKPGLVPGKPGESGGLPTGSRYVRAAETVRRKGSSLEIFAPEGL